MSAASEITDPAGEGGARSRSTRQFRAVIEELARSDDFRSAQDLHAAVREHGTPVGLATIYRALQSLVESGQADTLLTDTGESVYRTCGPAHHHHLICRRCGRTVEIQGPVVERWAARMGEEHGFAEVSHTVELSGVCGPCRDS